MKFYRFISLTRISLSQNLVTTLVTCVIVLLGTPFNIVFASESGNGDRPRIGLVLGGGGAKGAAHIGVLGVLDELQIPIDCVVGTSMGALVGGTFATGMPPAEIEEATLEIDWTETVGKEGLRDRTPINRKLMGTGYTNSLELGIKDGSVNMPGGLLKTQDIEDVIRDLVNDARLQRDFDALSIPFRAVATDMVTGDMVVMGSGDIALAMRASMAVPGAFSPVIIDGKVLSDGGMVRNLPVDIARELCADVVIAVWLTTPLPKAEELNSALALVARSMAVMINANESAQIETLTADDIGIEVAMGDIGTGDFQRVPDAIELGRAAAKAMRENLRRYSVSTEEYLAWRGQVSTSESPNIRIADVEVEGLAHVNPDYVIANLRNVQPGAEVSADQIGEDIKRIYALGEFDRVDYHIAGEPDEHIVRINPVEKSRGPNFIRFDFGLYAENSGELQALLRGEHTRSWMNERGGSWDNVLQIGRETVISTSVYQPLDVTRRFFFRPTIEYNSDLEPIYNDGERVARYYLNEFYGELAFGANLDTRAQFVLGLRRGWLQTRRDTGPTFLPESGKEDDASVFFAATYDTRDDIGLPTRGSLVHMRYMHSDSWLGGEQEYDLIEGVIAKSFPWRDDSLSLIAGGGKKLDGVLPPVRDFRLGGIQSFPGLRMGELRGTSYWYAGSSYLWKLADIQPLLGQALYAGLRLQAGRMGGRRDQVNDGTLYGISGSLNGRTPIGPFVLSLGYVTNDSWELQFSLGRPLPEGSALDEIH